MQIHELNKKKINEDGQLNEVDVVGPNSIFNKAKAGYQALKQGGVKSLLNPAEFEKQYQAAINTPRVQQLAQAMAQQWSQLADQIEATPAPRQQQAPAQAPAQAKPATLKQKVQAQQTKQSAPTTNTGGINLGKIAPAPNPGAPTSAEREKFEKRVAAASSNPVTEVVAQVGSWTNEQYKQRFVQWVNTMLARTQISLDQIKEEMPQVGSQFEGLINDVVYLRNSKEQIAKVAELMERALGAVTAIRQQQRVQGTEPQQAAPQTATIAQQAPALLAQLAKSGPIKSTGNPAVDQVLKSIGFQI